MQTIVEPKQHIDKLWGKQRIKEDASYRLMKYVLRVDYEGKVLLHNVVTGQLVVLDPDEAEALNKTPIANSLVIEQMVTKHYLVPEEYDEHQQVVNLRTIVRTLYEAESPHDITTYTILTTTACNARCYYCFEHGAKIVTMSEETANNVIQYIVKHCGKQKTVNIAWFGGEPTLTPDRIDQICTGLRNSGISYSSRITTNGYLLDESLISRAKSLWNLKSVSISMDGVGERYNSIKSYINPKEDPFRKVLKNIGCLLGQEINVNVRLNFDQNNYMDFEPLIHEILSCCGNDPLLNISAHQINSDLENGSNHRSHGSQAWFSEKLVELNDYARTIGVYRKRNRLPSLISIGCKACMNSAVTITPEGNLVRCPEQFGEDQITGTVKDGVTNEQLIHEWKQLADIKICHDCPMFPRCLKVLKCSVGEKCCYRQEFVGQCMKAVIQKFNALQDF